MDNKSVPLLNPQQIQELNAMISLISSENSKKLQDIIGEQIEIENATIMQLYNLTIQQWSKKQNIIDNLCHFSLTMMATVEYLWNEKNDNEERIGSAQAFISDLNKQIVELGDENENFKRQISEAQFQIEQIVVQKQKIQELYRTQSCINFISESPKVQTEEQEIKYQQNLCCDHQNLFEKEKQQMIGESLKLLDEKQIEMSSLKQENMELSNKLSSLMEEHELMKMEIQLAQIAVKDALSYKEASVLNSSQSQFINMHQQIYTTKSHAQFMNGEIQCFSNFNDNSINLDCNNSPINNILEIQGIKCKTEPSIPFLNESFRSQYNTAKQRTQDITAAQNPFKKKTSKISQLTGSVILNQSILSHNQQASTKNEPKYLKNNQKKTVSIQCNLVKGLQKLSFEYKKNLYEEQYKPKAKHFMGAQSKHKNSDKINKKESKINQKYKPQSKSQIITPVVFTASRLPKLTEKIQVVQKVSQHKEKNSINKIYNFFSSKLISQRIKVK